MGADGSHLPRQSIVIGEKRTAVAIATKRLRRKKAGAAYQSRSSAPTSSLRRAKALRRVLNDGQAVSLGNGVDSRQVRHLAKQADGQQRFCTRRNGSLDQVGIHIECCRIDIDKDG